jgi:uncharacterized protein (TIGR00290 family)
VALLTAVSSEHNRISIHGIRHAILLAQAASLRLPLVEIRLEPATSNASYEAAFAGGLVRLRQSFPGIETVAFGDLFLEDVRQYRERLLEPLGWKGLYPLWKEPTLTLARHFISRGYRAIITCVDTTQLDAGFAGREFDDRLLVDLPASVDPCGERGEFHTCVYAGPIFRAPIPVRPGERVLRDGRFEYCDLALMAEPGGG